MFQDTEVNIATYLILISVVLTIAIKLFNDHVFFVQSIQLSRKGQQVHHCH